MARELLTHRLVARRKFRIFRIYIYISSSLSLPSVEENFNTRRRRINARFGEIIGGWLLECEVERRARWYNLEV